MGARNKGVSRADLFWRMHICCFSARFSGLLLNLRQGFLRRVIPALVQAEAAGRRSPR